MAKEETTLEMTDLLEEDLTDDIESNNLVSNQGNLPLLKQNRKCVSRVCSLRYFVIGASLFVLALILALLMKASTSKGHDDNSTCKENSNSSTSENSTVNHLQTKNVIFMLSDGFGPAISTLARSYQEALNNNTSNSHQHALDEILRGTVRTKSSSSLVTDSAAGATAYSCAMKTNNKGIAVDPSKKPCGTILEGAKFDGMRVGIVATSRLSHATPCAFSAHVLHRDMEDLIAEQQFKLELDVMLGGGRGFYVPQEESDSNRTDNWNGLQLLKDRGTRVVESKKEFDALDLTDSSPVFGVFAQSHINYELDRNDTSQPSLLDMSKTALGLLHRATIDKKKGFFLLIEGSRIDHAAHDNDAAALANEVLAYLDTVKLVRKFVKNNPDTLVISTSDHDTGGLSLGYHWDKTKYPTYEWFPKILTSVKQSAEAFSNDLLSSKTEPTFDEVKEKLNQMYPPSIFNVTGNDTTNIHEAVTKAYKTMGDKSVFRYTSLQLKNSVAVIAARQAGIGFSSVGHSGVDINLYADGKGATNFHGNMDNTEVGAILAELLNIDLKFTTSKIKDTVVDNNKNYE